MGVKNFRLTKSDSTEATIYIGKKAIGALRYNGFTLLTQELITATDKVERILTDVQHTRSIELSLIAPKTTPVGDIISAITDKQLVEKVEFVEEYSSKELGNQFRSVLLRIMFVDKVDDNQIKATTSKLTQSLEESLKIKIRS